MRHIFSAMWRRDPPNFPVDTSVPSTSLFSHTRVRLISSSALTGKPTELKDCLMNWKSLWPHKGEELPGQRHTALDKHSAVSLPWISLQIHPAFQKDSNIKPWTFPIGKSTICTKITGKNLNSQIGLHSLEIVNHSINSQRRMLMHLIGRLTLLGCNTRSDQHSFHKLPKQGNSTHPSFL